MKCMCLFAQKENKDINDPFTKRFFFFFLPYHVAYGILVPHPGIEPVSLTVKV